MSVRTCVRLFVALFLSAVLYSAAAGQPFSFESTPGKLPKNIVPRHYAIRLQPDLEKFTTRGSVIVDLEVLKPAKEIVFNALDLEITKATLQGKREIALKPSLDAAQQTVTLKLPKALPPGTNRLALEFKGRIGEQAQGLFYVRYAAPSGKKILLATQMEPADARRMFPCWDEPAFRAAFDLTVVLPEYFKAVSNMPIEKETPLPGKLKEVKFAATPSMASYLVVLVAGELEMIEDHAEGVAIRVITTEGKREQGRYALEATKNLLAYYDRYFGIRYPLPKLDQIAIPGGFEGAMENWGGITYNERNLLYDPTNSSLETRREIFVDVSHEMAHQWFGDLVTMAWWDNLWLNEGFATWMETKATSHFNPDWEMSLSADADTSGVMSADAHGTTHPIQQPVNNESEANDAFDDITYQKGAAFLRMMEAYLGPEDFRKGIYLYLQAHKYSNSTTEDLWQALEEASGKPIRAISAGWTEQPGVPLVNVKSTCVDGCQIVSLEQERFTVNDPQAKPLQWQIPVGLDTEDSHTQYLLTNASASVTLSDCAGALIANSGANGYYRVLYSPELFRSIWENLNRLAPVDRLKILQDTWALMEAGRTSIRDYLILTARLQDERTYLIWNQIISSWDSIDALEKDKPGRAAFREYACSRLQPVMQRLGWDPQPGETLDDSLLRGHIIAVLGHFGDAVTIAEAKARFQAFLAKPKSLNPELRSCVLHIVGRYADQKTYNQLHDLARQASDTEQRQLYYSAMSFAQDPALAKQTLALSLTDETVPQEATGLVPQVADSSEQPELAWEFAQQHMKELLAKVDAFERNDFVPGIFHTFSDVSRADELETYVKKNISEEALNKAAETADNIRLRAAIKARELPVVDRWVNSEPTK
jgi:aminopeptidase N